MAIYMQMGKLQKLTNPLYYLKMNNLTSWLKQILNKDGSHIIDAALEIWSDF